jgi:hypothetical protein
MHYSLFCTHISNSWRSAVKNSKYLMPPQIQIDVPDKSMSEADIIFMYLQFIYKESINKIYKFILKPTSQYTFLLYYF